MLATHFNHLEGLFGIALFQVVVYEVFEFIDIKEVEFIVFEHSFKTLNRLFHMFIVVCILKIFIHAVKLYSNLEYLNGHPEPAGIVFNKEVNKAENAVFCAPSFQHKNYFCSKLRTISMTLIKSISGIRGTIGGKVGDNLSPEDVLLYTASYAQWLKQVNSGKRLKVVIGRDARMSGEMVSNLVASAFMSLGIDVIDLGLSTTPTVEMAVAMEGADGGIIITASHNPRQWNALKLLNGKGEFVSAADGKMILDIAEKADFNYCAVEDLGKVIKSADYPSRHIEAITKLDLVNAEAIRARKFRVVLDAVNSTGGIVVPAMLSALGVEDVIEIYCEPNGDFPHDPEPLAKNLSDLCRKVTGSGADLGIAVDPDVDRLVFVQEDGHLFGEEYTLVSVADYVLSKKEGQTVSNLSSTRALRDVAERHGRTCTASAVGEVNVVEEMKKTGAVIGGEGNGGVILPELHYGRDALVGIALFLSHLSTWKGGREKVSELKASYPMYYMSKNKIELEKGMNVDGILDRLAEKYSSEDLNRVDGLKIDFESEWVHLRKSNTEPIIRIYSEAGSQKRADELASHMAEEISALV